MTRFSKVVLHSALLLLLAGCASTPEQDSAFAPTYPIAAEPPVDSSGSIYKSGFGMSLFEDTKAHRVGDLLTVVLQEKTQAQKKASTSTAKDQNIGFDPPTIFGDPVLHNNKEILSVDVGMSRDFTGDGASSQSNSLTGNITVFVAQVLPNGNLVIRGEKQLTLNQGDEYIRLSGIVRPSDVKPDNTVDSSKVANAQILYSGDGAVADANSMGWLGRFFNGPIWPF